MLRTDTAVTIYRKDYTAPAFRIDEVALEIGEFRGEALRRSGRNSLRQSGKNQWEQRETGGEAARVLGHRQEGSDGADAAPAKGGGRRETG